MRAVEFVHGDDGGRATAVAIAQEAFEDWRAVSSCPGPRRVPPPRPSVRPPRESDGDDGGVGHFFAERRE